jgi:phage shock protein E
MQRRFSLVEGGIAKEMMATVMSNILLIGRDVSMGFGGIGGYWAIVPNRLFIKQEGSMTQKNIYLLIPLLFMIVLNCSAQAKDVKQVPAKDALSLVKDRNPQSSILIDGRSAEMFAAAHIQGAVNIDAFKNNAGERIREYLNKKQIILYCTRKKRSETLIKILKNLRFSGEIVFITDGITGWKKSGYEVTRRG